MFVAFPIEAEETKDLPSYAVELYRERLQAGKQFQHKTARFFFDKGDTLSLFLVDIVRWWTHYMVALCSCQFHVVLVNFMTVVVSVHADARKTGFAFSSLLYQVNVVTRGISGFQKANYLANSK